MICSNCGKQIPDDSKFCGECGTTYNGAIAPEAEPGKDLGLAAMILGFVALGTQLTGLFAGVSTPAAIAALICGFMAKSKSAAAGIINNNARTGIICAFVQIGLSVLSAILAITLIIIVYVIYFVLLFGVMAMPYY